MTKTVSRVWTGVLMILAVTACGGAGDMPSVERPATTVQAMSPSTFSAPRAPAALPAVVTTTVGQSAVPSAADKVVAEADALIAEADELLNDDLDA